jgi:hypothetical protein
MMDLSSGRGQFTSDKKTTIDECWRSVWALLILQYSTIHRVISCWIWCDHLTYTASKCRENYVNNFFHHISCVFLMLSTECISMHTGQAEKFACMNTVGIEPTTYMLFQPSYEVKSVQVCGISELSLYSIFDTDVFLWSWCFCVCFDVMYSGKYNVSDSRVRSNFSACPVWIYTQSNIRNIISSIVKCTLNFLHL